MGGRNKHFLTFERQMPAPPLRQPLQSECLAQPPPPVSGACPACPPQLRATSTAALPLSRSSSRARYRTAEAAVSLFTFQHHARTLRGTPMVVTCRSFCTIDLYSFGVSAGRSARRAVTADLSNRTRWVRINPALTHTRDKRPGVESG